MIELYQMILSNKLFAGCHWLWACCPSCWFSDCCCCSSCWYFASGPVLAANTSNPISTDFATLVLAISKMFRTFSGANLIDFYFVLVLLCGFFMECVDDAASCSYFADWFSRAMNLLCVDVGLYFMASCNALDISACALDTFLGISNSTSEFFKHLRLFMTKTFFFDSRKISSGLRLDTMPRSPAKEK